MTSKPVYRYYWWYILLISLPASMFVYLAAAMPLWSYQNEPFSSDFWLTVGISILIVCFAGGYLAYIISYRLTEKDNGLEERSIFGRHLSFRTIVIPPDATPRDMERLRRAGFSDPHISIFCNGFAVLKRTAALEERDFALTAAGIPYPPVPSLHTFHVHHRYCIALALMVAPLSLYCLWFFSDQYLGIKLLLHVGMSATFFYLWHNYSNLSRTYFERSHDVFRTAIPIVLVFLLMMCPLMFINRYDIASYIPFGVASFVLTFIIHQLIRVPNRIYYMFFLWLLPTLFGLLIFINCLPREKMESIQTTVHAKKEFDTFPPYWGIRMNVWNNGESTKFELSQSVYDQIQIGDKLSVNIYSGLLGVRWVETSRRKNDTSFSKKIVNMR